MISIDHALPFSELLQKGVLAGTAYNPDAVASDNYYGVTASLKEWPKAWLEGKRDSYGWFAWLIAYQLGARCADDPVQILRWQDFARRHGHGLMRAAVDNSFHIQDTRCWKRGRQALLHWALDSEHPRTYIGFSFDLIMRYSHAEREKLYQLGFLPQILLHNPTEEACQAWLEAHKPKLPSPEQQRAALSRLPTPVASVILANAQLQ